MKIEGKHNTVTHKEIKKMVEEVAQALEEVTYGECKKEDTLKGLKIKIE